MIKIKLSGAEKLLQRINKAKNEKGLYRLATREAAKEVAAQVKQDLPKLTGTTARNVKVRATKGKIGASVIVGQSGTQTYKGWFLEVGTTDRVQQTTGRATGKVKAGHYVMNALARLKDKVLETIKAIVGAKVWH